jgi:tagatose 1,6-diphosphate aldolase
MMQLREIAYVNTDLPEYWKPYYIFEIIVGCNVVGKIVLREGEWEERYYDGHIGFTIYPPYQGNNYAYQATILVLQIAKNKGFKEIIITCSPNNIPSKKTIQKLPTKYLETKTIPKKFNRYVERGEKIKEIYHISL